MIGPGGTFQAPKMRVEIDDEQRLSRVYQNGYNAYYDGKKEEDNPHYHSKDGSLKEWSNGWHDAKDEDKQD